MFKQMNLTETAKKWSDILDYNEFGPITNQWKRKVTAQLIENQVNDMRLSKPQLKQLVESAPTNNYGGGNIASWDPILISLVRRSMPNLIAYDICGVQPMSGPSGLVFAITSRYSSQTGTEALFNEADVTFSGNNAGQTLAGQETTSQAAGTDPFGANYGTGGGMTELQGETLGDGSSSNNNMAQMAFSISKVTVEALTRALQAQYSTEIEQDLKAVHGLDAQTELSNMLSAEILTEINREIVRKLYYIAYQGAQQTATPGTFDLDVDSDGRWSVERFKGLLFQLERDANRIAKLTRRGKGNILVCSSDVASALVMAGVLDYTPALSTNLSVDDTGNTFAGVLNGKMKVYIDPYFISSGSDELAMVGYKGSNPYDAGFFYCPYVPLQLVRALDPLSFQPALAFKTRYGLTPNPFYTNSSAAINSQSNPYYALIKVLNLL